MSQKRSSFPLQWPEGWKRSVNRFVPKFSADGKNNFTQTRDRVLRRLRARGSHAVITSDLPLRGDGLPYADARCADPGVAVWWVEKGKEMVIACDRWRTLPLNLSAIDRTLEAMAGIERWGADTMVDRVFAGFAALPPPGYTSEGTGVVEPPAMPPWREVFKVPAVFEGNLSKPDLLAFVKLRYREQIAQAHPDKGGNAELAAIINGAMEEAEKELTA